MSASLDEQLKCVEREISMRKRVYPRWVADGRMSSQKAEYEIATMNEVAESLFRLKDLEK